MNCKATIAQWQNAVLSLDEHQFFDIMRLYLGEIKTPYNKQRLTEQLASFIHNEENQENILSLLDSVDLSLISAVRFIENPTKEVLSEFFSGEYQLADIYFELSNLVSRLILFIQKDVYSGKEYYRINPLLEEKIGPLISVSYLLRPAAVAIMNMEDQFSISPNFIAGFVSFLNHQGCSCKMDGTVRKTDMSKIQAVFPGKEKCIQKLIRAFINLSLVIEGEKRLEVDEKRLEIFAQLSTQVQYALLTVGACTRLGRENLKKHSELILDTLASIPQSGYTISAIKKIAYLASSNKTSIDGTTGASRFSQILQAAKKSGEAADETSGSIIEMMIESAVDFGLLCKLGTDEEGRDVYKTSDVFAVPESAPKVLNVDSTFTVTILPGLSLKDLLPLTNFLQINSCSVVTDFLLTKQSASVAFDKGYDVEMIFNQLESYSSYALPQNLKINVTDWYNNYVSAMVYYGYVLKVTGNNISIAENNSKISRHIKEKLADGVYLLDIPPTKEIQSFLSESGLDFMGKVRTPSLSEEKIPFPLIKKGSPVVFDSAAAQNESFANAASIINELKTNLETMDLTKEQHDNLLNRINQRLIISKNQLMITSVRTEILEAAGTDHGGKMHLIDAALATGDTVEIVVPNYKEEGQYFTLIGKPIGFTKQGNDAIARFELLPDHSIENFIVSKITHLKRLRF